MKRLVICTVGILVVLMASACVQAKLELLENFDAMATGSPDGRACTGVLGGTWDTQGEGTGNVNVEDNGGSRVLQFRSHSSGVTRGVGFNGITNPITEGETGVVFLRFMFRTTASESPRTYIGLISDEGANPITGTSAGTPTSIPVGFGLLDNGSGGFNVTTTDGLSILRAGLSRGQWYNVWIVADHSADTFDLYLSEAGGPAGEATLPAPEGLVKNAIPFAVATTGPLNGMIFACPNGTGQSTRTYIDEIWWDGDQGLAAPTKARNPIPDNGATDVFRDDILSWTAAPSAVAHDVYLGTNSADVVNADTSSPLLVSRGQAGTTYDPGRLELGQSYFWRVDEVNAPPDSTVFKGEVWSFTVEPVAYPIPSERITATASSEVANKGPQNIVNGSGLDATGLLHGREGDGTMWLSSATGPQPTWIEFEPDKVYRLGEMWVWNSNESLEPLIGLGVKEAIIEYSLDGAAYVTLGTTHQFAQAPGTADYAHNTTVDLAGVEAKFVKLTIQNNWGGLLNQYGLAEVRFFFVPLRAREPDPANASGDVAIDATLRWRPGRQAGEHQVYVSTDEQAVIDGTAPVTTVAVANYGPLALDLDSTYHWRVDEVNGVDTWQGDLWSFTTQGYLVVDDFESYNDIEAGQEGSNLIYLTWIDGFDNPSANGSTIGYVLGNPQETATVYGGRQSVPLMYNNTTASFSEATVNTNNLAIGRDWSKGGAQRLSLWFYGDPNNVPERMYVKVNNAKATYEGNLTTAAWQEWVIDLTALGVNLSNVTTLTVGFERTGAVGGTGTVLLDEIRLYPPAPPVVSAMLDSKNRAILFCDGLQQ